MDGEHITLITGCPSKRVEKRSYYSNTSRPNACPMHYGNLVCKPVRSDVCGWQFASRLQTGALRASCYLTEVHDGDHRRRIQLNT